MNTSEGIGRRKVRVGHVVSDRMDKTVVVAVEWRRAHRLYRKGMRRTTEFKAHDEGNVCQVGDMVRIVETRPLSKTKRWRVVEILKRREIPEPLPVGAVTAEKLAAVQEVAPPQPATEPAEGPVEEATQEARAQVEGVVEEKAVEEAEIEEEQSVAETPKAEATQEKPAGEPKRRKRRGSS